MRNLEAKTSFSYGTRRLRAGDYFTARTTADARALVALGKAGAQNGESEPPKPAKPKKAEADGGKDLVKKLRADYEDILKKKPFAGWDAAELQRRIDEALR